MAAGEQTQPISGRIIKMTMIMIKMIKMTMMNHDDDDHDDDRTICVQNSLVLHKQTFKSKHLIDALAHLVE